MKFKPSPKIFRNYKSAPPQKTISEINKFLGKFNSDFKYVERKIVFNKKAIYVGNIVYNDTSASWGKGISKDLCRAAAYSELIERLLAGISPISPFLKIPFKKLKKKNDNKVKISEFLKFFLISDIKKNKFNDWVEVFSLTDNKKYAIPHFFVRNISSSNGMAAGNTLEEAVSQAFCEICERYSLIEHLTKKIPAKTIRIKKIKNNKILKLIKLFKSLNFDIEIKDLTLKNKVPVMGVLFTNNNVKNDGKIIRDVYHKSLFAASHFNLEEAIIRCFTEKFQASFGLKQTLINPGKINLRNGKQIDIFKEYFNNQENKKIKNNFKKTKHYVPFFTISQSFENFDFLDKESIPFSELKSVQTNDFLEDIHLIKKISKKNKWNILILDYSIKKCSIKVVRVIIPSVSDVLRYKFKKIKSIDLLSNRFSLIAKDISNLNSLQKFNFLKFVVLPEIVIPYFPISTKKPLNYTEIIKNLLILSRLNEKYSDQKKLEILFDNREIQTNSENIQKS